MFGFVKVQITKLSVKRWWDVWVELYWGPWSELLVKVWGPES